MPALDKHSVRMETKFNNGSPELQRRTIMNEEQINNMVARFLGWKLPADFSPDAGISFKQPDNKALWPTGTNLLTATQAKAMVQNMLDNPAPEEQPA